MLIKTVRDEDYSSYKEVSMLIAFPYCSFKCCTDIGRSTAMCHNSPLARLPVMDVEPEQIVDRYMNNVITHSIVFGGLEPMDSFDDAVHLIDVFRRQTSDPIIAYTGYTEEEMTDRLPVLCCRSNIIVKFGRYVPSQMSHFDSILGVTLASPNQYAKKLS